MPSFGLLLSASLFAAACTSEDLPEPASTGASESTQGPSETETETGPASSETSGAEAGETTGEESGETTGAESGETTGEEPGTTTSGEEECEWDDFASKLGSAGLYCGSIVSPEPEEFEALLVCLNEALEAGEAAYGSITFYDGGDNTQGRRWFVRPEGEEPRIFEIQRFRAYVEEGPTPDPSYDGYTCTALVAQDCEDLPYPSNWGCTACEGQSWFACEDYP